MKVYFSQLTISDFSKENGGKVIASAFKNHKWKISKIANAQSCKCGKRQFYGEHRASYWTGTRLILSMCPACFVLKYKELKNLFHEVKNEETF